MKKRLLSIFLALALMAAPGTAGALADDGFTVTGGSVETSGTVHTIKSGNVTVTGTTDTDTIVISGNATVTLDNVSITSATASPISVTSGKVNIVLKGENTLTANDTYGHAALHVGESATVNITEDSDGGSLKAESTGNNSGAGIGGNI